MNQNIIREVRGRMNRSEILHEEHILHVMNGLVMYNLFREENLLHRSVLTPFNEAMAVHLTTTPIFSEEFMQIRAEGHNQPLHLYQAMVIEPLEPLFEGDYQTIYLWFGDDVFCQMNVLTLLAYLEQEDYQGEVILIHYNEKESLVQGDFKVNIEPLTLENYHQVYQDVLVANQSTGIETYPVLGQAIDLYLEMGQPENRVTRYIREHRHLKPNELLRKLFSEFDYIGYGDTQYLELIQRIHSEEV